MNPIRNRLMAALEALKPLCYSNLKPADEVWFCTGSYEWKEEFDSSILNWNSFGRDETWGGSDQHYWFKTCITVPSELENKQVRAVLNTGATDIWNTDNPQIMVFLDGKHSGTMDMNHQDFILTDRAKKGETHELVFYAYSNSPGCTNFFHLEIGAYEEDVAKLYYDLAVPLEAADLLEEDDLEQIDGFKVLSEAVKRIDFTRPHSVQFFSSVREADEFLIQAYYKDRPENPVTVHSIGHTHIDVAWKWPLKQTRQKAVRSFRTVLSLMERYPEYKFMSSQPQLYEFVKEEAPQLFEEIKEKIKEGRWETEGAMWLEPDCNLASGESLVRHILYGRRFFEKELSGQVNEVLWLPDVFGYSAAIPQIMKQSGLSYFMTTKLGWNEYNQFPYDTFTWRGIDGSEVLTYLISTKDYYKNGQPSKGYSTTYNGRQDPKQIMGTWQRFQNKDVSREVLTCYGYGDGGGGPTEEMLEQSRRMELNVARCPRTEQTFVKDFFHKLEKELDKKRLPVWSGELYLEFHRGTYTSMAKNKKYNRSCEFLNGDAEFYSVLESLFTKGGEYPKSQLEENWKLLLLNQFHDILPGSSIKEVYEDSEVQYEKILKSDRGLIKKSQESILKAAGFECDGNNPAALAVWNSLSFKRTGIVESEVLVKDLFAVTQQTWDGRMLALAEDVPSKGVTVIGTGKSLKKADSVFTFVDCKEEGTLKKAVSSFYEVEFDQAGNLSRIYDRAEERSLLKEGETGNQLLVFEDRPLEFDAWNIDSTFEEKQWHVDEVMEMKLLENGPVRAVIFVKRKFMDSVIEQQICFYNHTKRIDFKTRIDWNEHQMLLKTAFPLDILCNEANYDIQFGNVSRPTHRNTTWDQARFEVCAHKWADVSEAGYGAAVLNDCKYGYDVQGSVIRLTLLKSGIFPNPDADQGEHTFTYSLLPHKGDFRAGGVVQEAYDLNCPLVSSLVKGDGVLTCSFLEIENENILADTVKLSEDGDGLIVRFYESYGMRTNTHVTFPMTADAQFGECSCMEEVKELVPSEGGRIALTFKPYEIKTIKIQR